MRFFDDEKFGREVGLTKDEIGRFDALEYHYYKVSGMSKYSGGYANLTVTDRDCYDNEWDILQIRVEVGIEGNLPSDEYVFTYDRNTKECKDGELE